MVKNMKRTKLDAPYYGPFRVLRQAPFHTYKLAFPNGDDVTELIHSNRLRRANIGEIAPTKLWSKASFDLKRQCTQTGGPNKEDSLAGVCWIST